MTKKHKLAIKGYKKGIEKLSENKFNLSPLNNYIPVNKIKFLKRMIRNCESKK